MHFKGLDPVYLRANEEGSVEQSQISPVRLLGIDPLSDDAYYNFEAGFPAYESFYVGKRETIDLVVMNRRTGLCQSGLEIKLTALPDGTTADLSEAEYGCEMVVRPPTICFLACSICAYYERKYGKERLRGLLAGVPQINHWEEADEVGSHYQDILQAVKTVAVDMRVAQTPLILQPIWKTEGQSQRLAENCLDVFVWSNLALLSLVASADTREDYSISRYRRTIIWVYRMLFDYVTYGQFDYVRIIKNHAYGLANDKAFAISGVKTQPVMQGEVLLSPRVGKSEIKNIILGGGQHLLSPERRFDAVLVNSPDLF